MINYNVYLSCDQMLMIMTLNSPSLLQAHSAHYCSIVKVMHSSDINTQIPMLVVGLHTTDLPNDI